MDDGQEDPRLEELASLEAIFPEIQKPVADDPFIFVLELPVKPASPVTVAFPATASAAPSSGLSAAADAAASSQNGHVANSNGAAGPQNQVNQVNSHKLSYLPPISLRMSLPPGYPLHEPPVVGLHTTPQWLTPSVIRGFEDDAHRLWEEMGHDMVAYTYIDHMQQAAEDAFGMVDASGTLEVDLSHMAAILDHDMKASRAAFESETFDCGVCLGTVAHISHYHFLLFKANGCCRPEERNRLPQDDGLRSRFLSPMLTRLLRGGYQAGRRERGEVPQPRLRKGEGSPGRRQQEGPQNDDQRKPRRAPSHRALSRRRLALRDPQVQEGARVRQDDSLLPAEVVRRRSGVQATQEASGPRTTGT